MNNVSSVAETTEQKNQLFFQYFDKKFDELKKHFQLKEPTKYVTRNYVANEILHCDLSTIHNLTKRGILQKYQIGGRVLYKILEVENSIIKIKR